MSAKAKPTPSIAEIVPAVFNILLFATLEESFANCSGFNIISFAVSFAIIFPVAVFVADFKTCLAAVPTAALPTIPPIPPLIIFKGSNRATPKFAAKPLKPLPPSS